MGRADHEFEGQTEMKTHLNVAQDDGVKTFSDGSLYRDDVDFDFNYPVIRKWQGPCLISRLKSSSEFQTKDSKCSAKYAFICEWQGQYDVIKDNDGPNTPLVSGLKCPDGYESLGSVGDGRTCTSVLNATKSLSSDICDDHEQDDMRSLMTFDTTDHLDAILYSFGYF